MIFIQFERITDTKALVTFTHFMPFDEIHGLGKTEQELLERGALVESEPQKEFHPDKQAMLFYNPQTKELWYEYATLPVPEEDRISQLEIATEENKKANLDTQEAVLQLYEMVTGPLT